MIKVIEKPKIETKKFSFDLSDNASTDMFVQSLDLVPLVFLSKVDDTKEPQINGVTINARDVIYVKLFNSKFLPEIEISCFDSSGIFFSDLYPYDHDTILSIFVKSNSELTMPIRMDFRVTEFETIKASPDSSVLKYLIKGILDIDDLHYNRYEARKGTSYEILKQIALEMNLGFASNVDGSNDSMTWINPSETYLRHIIEVTEKAFISTKSFVYTFIDFYYNLNYVDIEKELDAFNPDEETASTAPQLDKKPEETITNLYLTNKTSFNMTNRYISKFNLLNQSYKVNLEKSYRMKATWYNKNENKSYREYLEDLETDSDKVKPLIDYTSLIYTRNIEDESIYTESVKDEYFIGKIDTDNVHANYSLADVSNTFNLKSIEKMKMVVTLNKINFDIKRFQNVKVEIFNINDLISRSATEPGSALDNINSTLSGYWFVTGINYIYKRTGGAEQEIILMRRDLSIDYGKGNDEKSDFRQATK